MWILHKQNILSFLIGIGFILYLLSIYILWYTFNHVQIFMTQYSSWIGHSPSLFPSILEHHLQHKSCVLVSCHYITELTILRDSLKIINACALWVIYVLSNAVKPNSVLTTGLQTRFTKKPLNYFDSWSENKALIKCKIAIVV